MGRRSVTVLYGASLVTADEVICDGWLRIEGGRIAEVGRGAPLGCDAQDLGGGWLVPGFIDIHCHGGAGADFASQDADEVRRAAGFHQGHGTTGMLASLVTAPVDELCLQLSAVADLVEAGGTTLLGSHLEGPFLSHVRCGAQNPAYLAVPDVGSFCRMLEASRGTLRMMTIAPELPGAMEVIEAATAAGVIAAVGHTDATYAQVTEAVAHGACVATHLFNGMRPLRHRDPGPVPACLDAGIACEVINDGVHVHPSILRLVAERDPGQLLLVTDAISAAGVGDGEFTLGGQPVRVRDGEARLGVDDSLAGSTLTMDAALRLAVHEGGLSMQTAVAGASTNPARVLGLGDRRGRIATGLAADLVHLSDDLDLLRVMTAGRWIP